MYAVQKEQEQEEPIEVLINKFIKSLNSYDWVSCLYLSKKIEDRVSALLLSQWNEPNYITDEFKTLRLWLVSDLNHELKAMQVRECLSDIWDKLSKYGIGVSREIKDEKQLGEMISNILLQMDSLISGVFSRSPAIKNASIQAINSYLTKLELSLKGFYSDDVALNEFCQYALTDLRRFKGELSKVASEDNINKLKEGVSDAYTLFKDSMEKLAEAIMYPQKRESIYITFEILRNVNLTRGKTQEEVKEVQEVVEVEYPETRSGEVSHSSFEWVDKDWEEILRHPAIYFILGRRGGGKSTLGYTIAEYLITKYKVKGYLLDVSETGLPPEKIKLLPPWIKVVRYIDDVPPNSVLLVDEAHKKFHAREASKSGEAITLDSLIGFSRQNNQSHIYVTHQSDKLDKNIVSSIDVLMIKPLNLFQLDTERKNVQEYIEEASKEFKKLREKGNIDLRSYVYIVADYIDFFFKGMKTWKPGSSWNPDISYIYKGVR